MDGFIPKLVVILDTDPEENCRFKAVSAISCLIRDNPEGQVINPFYFKLFQNGGKADSFEFEKQNLTIRFVCYNDL